MKKIVTVDGNEACSKTSYYFTEMAGIYPITPSSTMAENVDKWSKNGELNILNDKVKVVEMQSEGGAAGMVHGSLVSGVLTSTYTASQGLLLMIPNMYKIAGEMLPLTMHVAARTLSTHALSIMGDHSDVYSARGTGFAMLASSSVQDASLLSAVAHLSSIKSSIPFIHFFDGFRTSHEINKIKVLEKEDYEKLIDYKAVDNFRKRAMNPLNPTTRGTASNDDIFFQNTEARNLDYEKLPDIVNRYMKKINTKTRLDYRPFNYYGSIKANKVIVAMGSVCETIKETIDDLNKKGEKLGLIEVHLYRPFSKKYFLNELPETVKKIAVLDRAKEPGSTGEPLYLDVVNILKNRNIKIVGGRYGLASKDTTPAHIKAVYDYLNKGKEIFTVGIKDDVTNLSLEIEDYKILGTDDILLYGFGSDGMVSASKSIIKIVGNKTKKYVQGYFEYDSKKSGGITVSHLRISDKQIRKTYYVDTPKFIAVSKDSYLNEFDVFKNILPGSTFLLNTSKTEDEINDLLTDNMKYIIKSKKIKFYTVDAYKLASRLGLKNKISAIMASAIMYLSNIIDYETFKKEMKLEIENKFSKKGNTIVEANKNSIEGTINYLKEIKLKDDIFLVEEEKLPKKLSQVLKQRKGNELPVSYFLKNKDGVFKGGTSKEDKKAISENVPTFNIDNCSTCNQCSIVCPHAVIRPYLLTEEEYEKAPSYVKKDCKRDLVHKDHYFTVAISIKDCTGCNLCVNTCPGMKGVKALETVTLKDRLTSSDQDKFDYLNKNIKDKNLYNDNTVKGCQFKKCSFEFPGACAGCGETPYIKLLSTLVGEKLMIANATGCSSIYGGSTSSMPYNIPWASSLFEDNAEYGYGMIMANKLMKSKIETIMINNMNNDEELFNLWINNKENFDITKNVYENIDYNKTPSLKPLKDYIIAKDIWILGGDGWAYDIGFSGIDHILSSGENVNILVLDSEVYSNTGGQASKSTNIGAIASFAEGGKKTNKKDLGAIAMNYENVFVANISLGYSFIKTIKILKEAINHDGPSIIIAYSPCISHGIKKGMDKTIEEEKLATKCGYFPVYTYLNDKLNLISKDVDFDLYESFLEGESRYANLLRTDKINAYKLLTENKKNAINKYNKLLKLDRE